jgi:hypothetical protein
MQEAKELNKILQKLFLVELSLSQLGFLRGQKEPEDAQTLDRLIRWLDEANDSIENLILSLESKAENYDI